MGSFAKSGLMAQYSDKYSGQADQKTSVRFFTSQLIPMFKSRQTEIFPLVS